MLKGQLAGLMKQAQQMQENMRKMQEQLATVEVEGQSGAGMVKVVMTCKHDVKRVVIDASVMDDKEMLEDLILAAVNDGMRKARDMVLRKNAMDGGSLPGRLPASVLKNDSTDSPPVSTAA